MKLRVNPRAVSLAVASVLMASLTWVNAQQRGGATVAIDPDDIGGVVTSSKGPEAGVWVIAETSELPTKFARMVVTDEVGRYVIPHFNDRNNVERSAKRLRHLQTNLQCPPAQRRTIEGNQ